jgi:hypothetical protein
MEKPEKMFVVWGTDYSDHFSEGKVFEDRVDAEAYNHELFGSNSPFIMGGEIQELEYVPKMQELKDITTLEKIEREKLLTIYLAYRYDGFTPEDSGLAEETFEKIKELDRKIISKAFLRNIYKNSTHLSKEKAIFSIVAMGFTENFAEEVVKDIEFKGSKEEEENKWDLYREKHQELIDDFKRFHIENNKQIKDETIEKLQELDEELVKRTELPKDQLKRKDEQETKNTMTAEDVVAAIESMPNGERLKTLKLLHETYFFTRPFPSSANERLNRLEERVEALEIKMGVRKEYTDGE